MGLVKDFKTACQTLREQLLAGRLATPEEVASYWPGGAENDLKNLKGWIYCREQYARMAARVEQRERDRGATQATKRAAVLDALAETPELVELVAVDETGNRRTLTVYPKSDAALRKVHVLNLRLASLVDDYHVISTHGGQNEIDAVETCLYMQGYIQRVIVWIATTEGPRLPFDERVRFPDVPEEINELSPLDFYSIAQAFQRVNVARFAALESATTPKSRPDWSVFWSGMEFETGTPARELMFDRSLTAVVAAASERARGQHEAQQRADAASKRSA